MSQQRAFGNQALGMASSFSERKNSKYPGRFPYEDETQKFSSHKRGRVLNKERFSIVFMGTPEFACFSLEKLIEKENVVAVVTQPDKPKGRGKRVHSPPVKTCAQKRSIPVYQPENIKDKAFLDKIASLHPDLIIVVAFGQLLSQELLNVPALYSINLHPSLLPKYKGPAPIPWVLIRGEKETGVTIQKMSEKVDSGEIILQKVVPISIEDTAGTLSFKLSRVGGEALVEAIQLIKKGKVRFRPQEGEESYAPKITKDIAGIDWKKSAFKIYNLIRGLNPYPGSFTTFIYKRKIQKIKIWKAILFKDVKTEKRYSSSPPGMVVKILKEEGFVVKTGRGLLLIKEVQLPNKPKISAYDFVKGYHIEEGVFLGKEN